jgi:hypothetical protein
MREAMEWNNYCNLVTGDERWFALEFQHSAKWSVSRDDVSQKVRQQIDVMKFMLTVMWGVDGFHLMDLMTTQKEFDSPYFVANVLSALVQRIFPAGRRAHAVRLSCHLDNFPVHFSKVLEKFFVEN